MFISLIILIVSFFARFAYSQDYIDDIPIENYNHGDHVENYMDLELLPIDADDPKHYFFRSMRSYDANEDLPRPLFETRKRREVKKETEKIVQNLGKPLELLPLDKVETTTPNSTNISINDYIRFRRSPEGANVEDATQHQWTKHIFPVRKSDELLFDDSAPSENIRVPTAHFVTQKFNPDNRLSQSQLKPYERESRARRVDVGMDRPSFRDLPTSREYDIREFDNPLIRRRFRAYDMSPEREYFRDEPYARYETRNYREYYPPLPPRSERYNRNDYTDPLIPKAQKRIIYYATLPELPRQQPILDNRDRYRQQPDRYRYDDRYLMNDPYRYGKDYPKSRYPEDETVKSSVPYPTKVLADLNVRDVKKNPERRIYSEIDRNRYAYNTPPYRPVDG